jgi:S-adenosylmethionine:tRNA ribosyltransferase-isomerase
LVDPARKIRVGNKLYFGDSDLVAEVIDNTTSRGRTIRFLFDGNHEEMMQAVYELGETPIPKDVLQREVADVDSERFQTIFADVEGAVAAPTAGIHFTKNIVRRMEINGVDFAPLTLHIGIGTFRQVEVEDLTKHKTDSENFFIPEETCKVVNGALDNKKRVCAIGSTSLRAMESSVSANDRVKPVNNAWTDKFIFPPYDFKVTNALLTNFHLPESILLMTTCAFGGYETITEAYQVAIKEKYKFFTYGDCMLII